MSVSLNLGCWDAGMVTCCFLEISFLCCFGAPRPRHTSELIRRRWVWDTRLVARGLVQSGPVRSRYHAIGAFLGSPGGYVIIIRCYDFNGGMTIIRFFRWVCEWKIINSGMTLSSFSHKLKKPAQKTGRFHAISTNLVMGEMFSHWASG